ncbi:hypothetical protein [Ruminococcus sp. NK3A76]|uniref:hypothetical protein n=1 Tax=Ruminococcus sp. NK3A76 TaxID=877411 RepID=UPI00048FC345|nr:hypothetical protein [Ruminococcus sp. NK3A76]
MRTIKTIFAVAGLIFLTSCSFIDDGNTKSVESVEYVETKDSYKNYEAVLNEEHSGFTLPDSIDVVDTNELYVITLGYTNTEKSEDKLRENGELLIKGICGESKDGGKIVTAENGDPFRYEYSDADIECLYDLFDGYIIRTGSMPELDYCNINEVFTDSTDEKTIELSGGNTTVKKCCDMIYDTLNNKLSDVKGGFELLPKRICSYDSNGEKGLFVLNAFCFNKIPIDYSLSPFLTEDTKTLVYYLDASSSVYITNDKSPDYINSVSRFVLKDKKKIEKMVSFEGAVDILENELADNLYLEFDDAELIYTCIKTDETDGKKHDASSYIYDTTVTYEFEPTWCFYIKQDSKVENDLKHPSTVRVNALTGEITVMLNK